MLGQCIKPWASINAVLAQRLVGHDIIIIIHDMSCFFPSKQQKLNQCCLNIGPLSKTMAQH